MNEIKIKKVSNGYILESLDCEAKPEIAVFNTDSWKETENQKVFCQLLWTIAGAFEEQGSKHDAERISICVRNQETDKEIE